MGHQIPANFDATQAWEHDFEARVQKLIDEAADAGLAMTVMVTYKRVLTAKDDSINEAAESSLLCARGGQHTHALMLATRLGSLFSDNTELMAEPKPFVSACLETILDVQQSLQSIASDLEQYSEPARFDNGVRVNPTKLN